MLHTVVGTAGHIDHGKSALVRALTGTDPDRLKEEKERGMTTDLGFAFLGERITIIDVPGHERFVRHMLAGASTIDMVLLVVAADDGVMPQTREHFEICRLMAIRRGIIVINKIDLVDPDWLELVQQDVQELVRGSFLEGAPVVNVSAVTGQGIDELRAFIETEAAKLPAKPDRGVFRLPVDRCFTIKGFGTVVAGTVLSGSCRVGDRLELLPQGVEVRVRGIQEHNRTLESVGLGERAALNLQGIERETVVRGNVLATPGYYQPTKLINATLYLLKSVSRPLRNMTRLKLHIGTAEAMCRVMLLDRRELVPGGDGVVQLRLEEPVVCDWGDRFVVRLYSPQQTLGGGMVLESNPERERRFDATVLQRLQALARGEAGSVLEQYLLKHRTELRSMEQATRDLALSDADARAMLEVLLETKRCRLLTVDGREYPAAEQVLAEARTAVLSALERFHADNPMRLGIKRPELRARAGLAAVLFEAVIAELAAAGVVIVEGDKVRRAGHELKLSPAEQKLFDRTAEAFRAAGLAPPGLAEALAGVERKLAERVRTALLETGTLVDVGESVVLHREAIAAAEATVLRLFATKAELSASEIRQALTTTRKILIPLLNYFDSRGLTQRKGDVRVLKKAR